MKGFCFLYAEYHHIFYRQSSWIAKEIDNRFIVHLSFNVRCYYLNHQVEQKCFWLKCYIWSCMCKCWGPLLREKMKIPYQSSMFSHWMCPGAAVLVRKRTLYNSVHNKYSSSLIIHNLYWTLSIKRDGYSAIRLQLLLGQCLDLKFQGHITHLIQLPVPSAALTTSNLEQKDSGFTDIYCIGEYNWCN